MQSFPHKKSDAPGYGYTANDFLDYVTFGIHHNWYTNNISFTSRKLNLLADKDSIRQHCVAKGFLGYEAGRHTILFVNNSGLGSYILATNEDGNMVLSFYGNESVIELLVDEFKHHFKITSSYVSWVYDQQYLSTMRVPIASDKLPKSSFYPFLNGETLEDYYKRFIDSDAQLLLLYGSPGCGKCLSPEEEIEIMVSDEVYDDIVNFLTKPL
jgi:hypothetical protein